MRRSETLTNDTIMNDCPQDSQATSVPDDGHHRETSSKRGRGRPKGAKNRRSPTPEGDIPPEERYFYQNRRGTSQISDNTLASVELLSHEEFATHVRKYRDYHFTEGGDLLQLHTRSFSQWHFELVEDFNICLYGWGSKRELTTRFAQYIHARMNPSPTILIILDDSSKVSTSRPHETIDVLFSRLEAHPVSSPIILIINSIDADPLRDHKTQVALAHLTSHPRIKLLATTDTANFPLLWDSVLRSQFRFVFHDCTTYAPFDAELGTVDIVHQLLGRKLPGSQDTTGIKHIMESLPENAKRLYRLLLTELVRLSTDSLPYPSEINKIDTPEPSSNAEDLILTSPGPRERILSGNGTFGLPVTTLYEKASDKIICTSRMAFHTLMKEFYDHQMIINWTDRTGTKLLGVPLMDADIRRLLQEWPQTSDA